MAYSFPPRGRGFRTPTVTNDTQFRPNFARHPTPGQSMQIPATYPYDQIPPYGGNSYQFDGNAYQFDGNPCQFGPQQFPPGRVGQPAHDTRGEYYRDDQPSHRDRTEWTHEYDAAPRQVQQGYSFTSIETWPRESQHSQKLCGGPSANSQGSTSKKKKAVQFKHNCDVCDRGFKTQVSFEKHFATHTKCQHPGCQFEGHVGLMKSHAKTHQQGKEIVWPDTNDEIERWRQERRKNYPTLANIADKDETMKINEELGNTLQTKHFGKTRPKHMRGKRNDSSSEKPETSVIDNVVSGTSHDSLSALGLAYGDNDSEVPVQKMQHVMCDKSVLSEAPVPGNDTQRQPWKQNRRLAKRNRNKAKKQMRREMNNAATSEQRREQRVRRNQPRKRTNLLEMLLAREIRRERNIILQCVRYVVRNDFLGVNAKAAETEHDVALQPAVCVIGSTATNVNGDMNVPQHQERVPADQQSSDMGGFTPGEVKEGFGNRDVSHPGESKCVNALTSLSMEDFGNEEDCKMNEDVHIGALTLECGEQDWLTGNEVLEGKPSVTEEFETIKDGELS